VYEGLCGIQKRHGLFKISTVSALDLACRYALRRMGAQNQQGRGAVRTDLCRLARLLSQLLMHATLFPKTSTVFSSVSSVVLCSAMLLGSRAACYLVAMRSYPLVRHCAGGSRALLPLRGGARPRLTISASSGKLHEIGIERWRIEPQNKDACA